MSLKEEKDNFVKSITRLESCNKLKMLHWIAEKWNLKELENGHDDKNEEYLEDIAKEIRETVPMTAILPSEVIFEPSEIKKEEREATLHVDEFLFSDELVDELVEHGKLSRHYCKDCGSRNIKLLNLISHSCSVERMQYIFETLLPPLTGKTFLDIGSRLGAVLYGAYVYTKAKKIVGIEMNSAWCKLVENISRTRNMLDRIDIICSDLREQSSIIASADVILVSNAFEYFTDKSVAESCWKFMALHIKAGATLILSPRAEHTFTLYDVGFKWSDWLTELPPYDEHHFREDDEFRESMAAYLVKKLPST